MAKRFAVLGFGLLAYALFGVSLLWLLAFLTNIGLPLTIDRGDIAPPVNPYAWNILLLGLFGIQHSVMARPAFKRWWTRHIPVSIERSMYVFISSALVLAICLLWKPIPGVVWQASSDAAQALWWAGFVMGVVWLIASSFLIDHFELLGLKQVWLAMRQRPLAQIPFAVRGLYRLMRHPIYVGWLLLFWCTPSMSWGHLLFAAGMTIYTLIAIRHEERDLMNAHGDSYREYCENVPALLPTWKSIRYFFSNKVTVGFVALFATALVLHFQSPVRASLMVEALAVTLESRSLDRVRIDTVDGKRTAAIVAPRNESPRRIVLMLHGAGGDPARIRLLTDRGLERFADRAGWLVAYPQGIGKTWNDCRVGPDYPAMRANVDDVSFLAQLIDMLRERYAIDAEAVLVAGYSNGGHMAMRMALERPEVLGGIAAIGAQLPREMKHACEGRSIRGHVMLVAGTEDPVSPYHGGAALSLDGASLGRIESVERTLALVARDERPLSSMRLPESDGRPGWVERRDAKRPDGGLIRAYIVHGGGHTIPGSSMGFPTTVGDTSADIEFAEELWKFMDDWLALPAKKSWSSELTALTGAL